MREDFYQDYYNAEMTHWWFRARRKIVADLLRQFTQSTSNLRIADIGCGTGASLNTLSEFGNVVAVDFSVTALSFSRMRGQKRLVTAALPDLPFPDNSFDIVCAMDIIEHVDADVAAACDLWRICKLGGLLLVTVPAYQWLWSAHDDVNQHKRRYSRGQLQKCLQYPGGEQLKLSYMNTLLAPPLMGFRLLKNLTGKSKNAVPASSDLFACPPVVNLVLQAAFASEAGWLRFGSLPFGISLIFIGRKHGN